MFKWISGVFWSAFDSIKEYLNFTTTSKGSLLLLGLDNAGKTTLLYYLTTGKVGSFQATRSLNTEYVKIGTVEFRTIDIGGQEHVRKLIGDYLNCDILGVMYMIDAVDHKRIDESAKVLKGLLSKEAIGEVPFLIMANKSDKFNALSSEKIMDLMKVKTTGKRKKILNKRAIECFSISIIRESGIKEALDWFQFHINNKPNLK